MASQAALDLVINLRDNNASSKLGGIASSLGTVGKIAGGVALGGVVALGAGLSAALAGGIGDAREAAIVMAQTEAVIKSTGGAAGVSAEQVAELAASLSASSGASLFGDDMIQQSTNLLLTFTNLKGGVLDAATAISVDMAQALGGAPKDAAIQLGKALNDPIAGVSALSRVGVTFSEEQKAVIASLVETGDVAGAQGIILAELNKEFGGSAAAAAAADGGFTQFRDRLGEVAETVGASFLPIMGQLGALLNSPAVMGAIESVAGTLAGGLTTAIDWLATTGVPALIAGWHSIQPALTTVLGVLREYGPTIAIVVAAFTTISTIVGVISSMVAAFGAMSAAVTASGGVLTAIVAVLGGPVTIAVGAVAVAVGLLYAAWQTNFLNIRGVTAQVWSFIVSATQPVFAALSRFWTEIQPQLTAAWRNIQTIVTTVLSTVVSLVQSNMGTIQAVFSGVWTAIQGIVQIAWALISGIIKTGLALLAGDWRGAWNAMREMLVGVWNGIKTYVSGAVQSLGGIIRAVGPALASAGTAIINMLRDGITRAWDGLVAGFKTKLQGLRNLLPFSEPKDASSPLRGLAKSGESILRNVADGIPKGAAVLNDKLTDSLTKVATLIQESVKAMTALASFDGSGIHEDTAFNFAEQLEWVVQSIADVAGNFKTKALAHAGEFADSAGKVLGLVGTGVDALAKLGGARIVAISGPALQTFVRNISLIVIQIQEAAEAFGKEGLEAASTFADHARKVVSMVGSAIDVLAKLGRAEFTAISGMALQVFVRNLSLVVIQIEEAAEGFAREGLEAAAQFSEAAGKVIAAVGSGIDAFVKLQDYEGVAESRIQAVANDMEIAATKMVEIAGRADTEGVEAAGLFAEALGKVFALFKTGVDALNALRDYQAVPRERMEAVLADFDSALRLMLQVTRGADVEGTSIAAGFAEAAKKIFDALKAGVSALDSIREFQSVPEERMRAFFGTMDEVLRLMAAMSLSADQYKLQAEAWRDSVLIAADAIKEGIAAIGQINKIPDLPSVPGAPAPSSSPAASSYYATGAGGGAGGAVQGGPVTNNIYNLNANYAFQDERTVAQDLRTLSLLGAA